MEQTQTINDLKAAFYDAQRMSANIFEQMNSEVVALNKRLAAAQKPDPAVKANKDKA